MEFDEWWANNRESIRMPYDFDEVEDLAFEVWSAAKKDNGRNDNNQQANGKIKPCASCKFLGDCRHYEKRKKFCKFYIAV